MIFFNSSIDDINKTVDTCLVKLFELEMNADNNVFVMEFVMNSFDIIGFASDALERPPTDGRVLYYYYDIANSI